MTAIPPPRKKTPKDSSEFEREQLQFFLARDDVAAVLADLNPSLAWLNELVKLKLIRPDTQLALWLERNFADPNAVRDVVANIQLFGSETAEILEFRFNRQSGLLSPLLAKSWRLILRHMKNIKRGLARDEWFDLAPRIKRGEYSVDVLDRLSEALRPKPRVGPRFSLSDGDKTAAIRPSDLMSIDFEIEEGLSEDEFLSTWPESAPAQIEEKLLRLLTNALSSAVEDAIDAEVESNTGYGTSDLDVPSVARHRQNQYRKGFLPIVRVMAELWTRLAKKSPELARPFVDLWQTSPFRLVRRLALFAAADSVVPVHDVARLLMLLPQGELFLTGSSVEVHRLLRARWRDLPVNNQQAVERRLCEGPPADWFKEDSDRQRYIDSCRYDLLGNLKRSGSDLSPEAEKLLSDIQARHPNWELKPSEQAGFHIWNEGVYGIVGDPAKLDNIPDDQLVLEAQRIAESADFMEGDVWQALCQKEPAKALRGLAARAAVNEWPIAAWRPFLWAAKGQGPASAKRIAELLLKLPRDAFGTLEMSQAASFWLNENFGTLEDSLLWPLWDKLEANAPRDDIEEATDE